MLKRFIAEVVEGKDLNEEEASKAMGHIMEGEALPTQIASFLTALRMKGETSKEIAGFARAMRAKAVRIRAKAGECVVDTCGTGGDGCGTRLGPDMAAVEHRAHPRHIGHPDCHGPVYTGVLPRPGHA